MVDRLPFLLILFLFQNRIGGITQAFENQYSEVLCLNKKKNPVFILLILNLFSWNEIILIFLI